MSDAVTRPVQGPAIPPTLAQPFAQPRRDPPEVTPAFRFFPSRSPLIGDIGVLAETYARAAEQAKARREATRRP